MSRPTPRLLRQPASSLATVTPTEPDAYRCPWPPPVSRSLACVWGEPVSEQDFYMHDGPAYKHMLATGLLHGMQVGGFTAAAHACQAAFHLCQDGAHAHGPPGHLPPLAPYASCPPHNSQPLQMSAHLPAASP